MFYFHVLFILYIFFLRMKCELTILLFIHRNEVNQGEDDPAEFLYAEHPELEKYRCLDLTGELVSQWYQERAREIEKCSHFVDASLDLLKLGRERGVKVGIRSLSSVLCNTVYL